MYKALRHSGQSDISDLSSRIKLTRTVNKLQQGTTKQLQLHLCDCVHTKRCVLCKYHLCNKAASLQRLVSANGTHRRNQGILRDRAPGWRGWGGSGGGAGAEGRGVGPLRRVQPGPKKFGVDHSFWEKENSSYLGCSHLISVRILAQKRIPGASDLLL